MLGPEELTNVGSGFDGLGCVPSGPITVRQGPVGFRLRPYINCTPMRVSPVFRRCSSAPVGPYLVSIRFPSEPPFGRTEPDGPRQNTGLTHTEYL